MDRINIKFTIDERNLIVNQTFAGDDLTERLLEAKTEGKYIKVAYTQPRSTASSTWAERSEMEVEPRGKRSRASVKSLARWEGLRP